jgi:hypothetical protein
LTLTGGEEGRVFQQPFRKQDCSTVAEHESFHLTRKIQPF